MRGGLSLTCNSKMIMSSLCKIEVSSGIMASTGGRDGHGGDASHDPGGSTTAESRAASAGSTHSAAPCGGGRGRVGSPSPTLGPARAVCGPRGDRAPTAGPAVVCEAEAARSGALPGAVPRLRADAGPGEAPGAGSAARQPGDPAAVAPRGGVLAGPGA